MTRFAHISDTHIRNVKYQDEYKIVFKEIYESLEREQPDYIIHTGDIAHTKTQLSPEYFELCSDFLRNLADIAPTYVILGNHDGNLKNDNRQDAITPIVDALGHKNLHLLKNSGETHLTNNVCLNVLSVFDRDNWVQPSDKSKINIALYHGAIRGCKISDNFTLESGEDSINIFDEFDFAMLGDIHRRQQLDQDGRIWYAGSTVQQNFGESLRKGYIIWDIRGKDSFRIEPRLFMSPRPFVTVEINQDGTLPNVEVPNNSRLRLVSNYNLPLAKLRRACDYARTKWNAYTVNFVNKAGYSATPYTEDVSKSKVINMRDPGTQEKYIRRFLHGQEISDEVFERVLELNSNYNKQLESSEDASRNVIWKLKKMKWNNLFNYGESNEINFEKLNGLVGIFGKNYSGKSSIIDAALFGMFNTTSKTERKNVHLINQNKEKAKCQLEIAVGNDTFKVTRSLEAYEKKSKGTTTREAKTDLDFTKYNLGAIAESKNGTTRNSTDLNIRNTFGTFDDFMITSMASQLDSLGFINEGSTKRKEILAKFLDLQMFEEKHKLAKKDSAEIRGIIKHLSSVDWQKKLVHGQEALEEIIGEIEEQDQICKKLTDRITDLKSEQSIVEDQLRSVESGWYDISEIETSLEAKKSECDNVFKKINKTRPKIVESQDEIQELRAVVSLIDYESLINSLAEYDSLRVELREQKAKLKILKSDLKACNKKIGLLSSHEYDPDCQYCCDNQFVKEAQAAKKQGPALVKKISSMENDIKSTNSKMRSINTVNINERISQYDNAIASIQKLERLIDKTESNINMWEAKKQLLKNEIAELVKKRDHYYENQEAFENIDSLKRDLIAIRKKVKSLESNLERCEKKIMSLKSEEGATRQQIKESESKINEVKNFEKDYIAYDLFIQAMHPNGVSYQVIKSMMSIINFEISKILNNIVDFEVFFDNAAGKLEIYIKHPRFDPRPLSMGSGAEKTIASMAIRLALISITNLPKSELFILDEPATALDEEHMEGFIRLLQMIKTQFKTVLLISHLESLKDIVDMTIDIQKKDGYAHVKI
tara:strand:- start:3002 stop:6157 length:3156 start_codon:yes stop_codon:yes gene_type:complete